MPDPKKPDDHEPDLGAELDDIEARLEASKQKIADDMKPKTPGKPITRQEEPASRTDGARLSMAEIDAKLGESRDARRARQANPAREKTLPPAKPSKT